MLNKIYSKNLVQSCNQNTRNYFIRITERASNILSDGNDTHVSGHSFLQNILKTPLRVPEHKMDIQLGYFEEDKRYEKNIY